jgi:Bacteriophage tail assembly protein
MLNSNMIKDMLNGRLDVVVPGKGMYHIPVWMGDYVFTELCSEVRDEKGWDCPSHVRNETWDLAYYVIGMCVSGQVLNIEAMDWEQVPTWAEEWDKNIMIIHPEKTENIAEKSDSDYSFGTLAAALA